MNQAVFGSQFFNFDTNSRKILVASDFWILWVLTGPLSLAIWLIYYGFRGYNRVSVRKALKSKHLFSQ